MTILIPCYEPTTKLIKLIESLKKLCDYRIILVDDGSGISYSNIFNQAQKLGCYVLSYEVNMGKGYALKYAFNYIKQLENNNYIVTADCDGQHKPNDIIKICQECLENNNSIIIGTRHFTGKVPIKSRFGNTLTRMVYTVASGTKIQDTQTGLRGFSQNMLNWLIQIEGERFEYEMNMLLKATKSGYKIKEIPIETIYENNNKSTHFHPIKDSIKIYLPIIKFSGVSIFSAIMDFFLLLLLKVLTNNLFISVLFSRILSSTFNYSANRLMVFNSKGKVSIHSSLFKYFTLAVCILILNYLSLSLLNELLNISLILSTIITESVRFCLSYMAQKTFVFKTKYSH